MTENFGKKANGEKDNAFTKKFSDALKFQKEEVKKTFSEKMFDLPKNQRVSIEGEEKQEIDEVNKTEKKD